MPMQLLQRLADHAARQPDRPAYIDDAGEAASTQTVNWVQLHRSVNLLSRHFAGVVSSEQVVFLCAPNDVRLVVSFLALMRVGAHVFLFSSEASASEKAEAVHRTDAKLIIAPQEMVEQFNLNDIDFFSLESVDSFLADDEERRGADDQSDHAMVLLQTSGTTARPRIICRNSWSLDAVSANMVNSIGIRNSDKVIGAVPLCHSYGMEHGMLAPIYAGASVHLMRGFDVSRVSELLRNGQLTVFPGVPFMFEAMAKREKADCPMSNLRIAYSASAPLPDSLFTQIKQTHSLCVSQLYGATEIGSVAYNNPEHQGFDPAGVGKPMHDVTIRITKPGEERPRYPVAPGESGHVLVKAPSMLLRYFDEPMASVMDGYFHTGDLGYVNQHGVLFVSGRIKLLIDVGGLKVNPLEVEAVLMEHPGVKLAVVVSVQVTQTVRRLKAYVLCEEGEPQPNVQDLKSCCREKLSGYKIPRVIEFVNELPMSPAGKVMRHQLEP